MKVRALSEMLLFVVLVLLQVLLLNHISVFGVGTPLLYIYFLIKLPMGSNRFYVIISGFLLGFIIDIFLNTPGMNAAATTIIASARKSLLRLFFTKEEYDDFTPGIHTSGGGPFVRFVFTIVLTHQLLLFFIESFALINITNVLLRVASSSAITLLLIFTTDSLINRKKATGEQ